jgi:hypothetical protein
LQDPGVNGKIILKWIFERLDGGIDLIDLAQNRDRAGSCEYGDETSVSIKCGELRVAQDLLASEEGLCSVELVSKA